MVCESDFLRNFFLKKTVQSSETSQQAVEKSTSSPRTKKIELVESDIKKVTAVTTTAITTTTCEETSSTDSTGVAKSNGASKKADNEHLVKESTSKSTESNDKTSNTNN